MRDSAGSDEAFIQSVLTKFGSEEFYYTLQPPALDLNAVDDFLFNTKRGFCEHFASAFTVMARSVGIPARVVTGYQGGEFNPMGGYFIVRQSDAHAWSEVWLEGHGWQRIDPTAAIAPERIERGLDAAISAEEDVPGRDAAPERTVLRSSDWPGTRPTRSGTTRSWSSARLSSTGCWRCSTSRIRAGNIWAWA